MIQIVRGLNKLYRRIDSVIGGICGIMDGIVEIISFGYMRTCFKGWRNRKCLHKFCAYHEDK